MKETTNIHGTDEGNLTAVLPHLRRQLLTLAKVHGQSTDYYRAALMPVIKAAMARIDGECRAD